MKKKHEIIEKILKRGWVDEIDYIEINKKTKEFENIIYNWDKYICCFYRDKNELIAKYTIYSNSLKKALDVFRIRYDVLFYKAIKYNIILYPHPYKIFWN